MSWRAAPSVGCGLTVVPAGSFGQRQVAPGLLYSPGAMRLEVFAWALGITGALVAVAVFLTWWRGVLPRPVARLAAGFIGFPRSLVRLLARSARSGVARPLRLTVFRILGRDRYDHLRVAVWARTKKAVKVDPLHADILPLIEQLDREGHLRAGAARRLRTVARGIRVEARREARASRLN